jgi:hypothetical protein
MLFVMQTVRQVLFQILWKPTVGLPVTSTLAARLVALQY